MNQGIIDRILETVRKNPEGLSIGQVADAAGCNRATAARHLDLLVWKSLVRRRKVGMTKLHLSVEKAEFVPASEVKE